VLGHEMQHLSASLTCFSVLVTFRYIT